MARHDRARASHATRDAGDRRGVRDAAPARWGALDLFRGLAVIAMIGYHFGFDLTQFGWLHANVYDDPRWIAARTAILSSFLLAAGMSLALARSDPALPGQARRYWMRIARIGGAAVLVSIGSWIVFRDRFIWFGVLHAIAVMSLLARPLLPLRGWMVPAGIAVIVAGSAIRSSLFDAPPLQWIGMMTHKPPTEDYVPILPWFGVMLAGAGLMALLRRRPSLSSRIAAWHIPAWLRWIGWMGRHSLLIYLVHQPLLFGAMTLVAAMSRGG